MKFPDLEFDSLEDAEASYISISHAYNRCYDEKKIYEDECFDKGMDANPLKIKKMDDDSLRLLQLQEAIADIIDQFNAQAA